ncbi:metal-dependent hydrolase [Macrococcoides caseolyticum]|uniref:metal-dependent hydrolase n=1 Tax=Macrococcoides caseolyticum TaxID=69966 RepID=UPI001F41A8F2|nr:metal-dependent hydrolase [Macrococcus caseolyticus]MCE4957286.1 metal-dependent hydrolase [Macrococcus caseolyticus]
MTGKTHIAFGVLIGTSYALQNAHDISTFAGIIGTTALFSIIPDICHSGSKAGKKIWPISTLISIVFGHRTLTHSIFFMIITSVLLMFLNVFHLYIICASIGLFSHLLLDMMTPRGVTLFFPWRKKIVFPITFKTGGIVDAALATTFSILTMYIFYTELFHRTLVWLN